MKFCPCNIQRIFSSLHMKNFIGKFFDIFNIFFQNIDCGYTFEPPHQGCSNEYPQSMFWIKDNKILTPCKPQFFYINVVYEGCTFHRHVILMSSDSCSKLN